MNTIMSEKQKEIINYNEDEDILVIACPGSGKTHTIICKYIKIITNNIFNPDEIILITFTKKAGNELSLRLSQMIPNNEPYYVGTIHGLAYKILKKYNNTQSNYTILDDSGGDYKNYILNLIYDSASDYDDIIKNNIVSIIDQISNTYPINIMNILIKKKLEKYYDEINIIYNLFKQKKLNDNIIDYNDLMILFCQFLDSPSYNSSDFKNSIKYIFFDEYQDINSIQNYILSKMNEKSRLMLVGDDAQSIYSFRGSSNSYILNNTKKIFLLEENYRSTDNIVNFCQNIITKNTMQINKNVISTHLNSENKPNIYEFEVYSKLYKWLCNKILKKINNGINLSNIVILARTNNVLENFELYLLKKNISYSKHLGTLLLNKNHIKDYIAFVVVSYNPKSEIHWKRILSLENYSNINELFKNDDIFKVIKNISELKRLNKLYSKIKKYNNLEKMTLILNYFKENYTFSNNEIKDIEKLIKYFKDDNLNDFINNIYINYESNNLNCDNTLYLTTIHGSKGLEWKHVYLIDQNINNKNFKDFSEEEERRIYYVGSSRAKKNLTILCLNNKSFVLNEIIMNNKQLFDIYNIE